MPAKILVLGAAGNGGRRIINLLLKFTNSHLILVDRNEERLNTYVNELIEQFGPRDFITFIIDAKEREKLEDAFKGVDLVIVASSTIDLIENVMNAVIKNKCDYLDIQGPSIHKYKYLYETLDTSAIEQSIITDCGAWPGSLMPMIKHASSFVENIDTAYIYGFFNLHWDTVVLSPQTITEMENFYDENKYQPAIYKNNKWTTENDAPSVLYNFGDYGIQECTPTFTRELSVLPEIFSSIKEIGFYKNFGDDKYDRYTVFTLEATGFKEDKSVSIKLSISHTDGYMITAAGIVGCVLQYLKAKETQHGLYMMGEYVNPQELFEDFKKFGLGVELDIFER